MSKLLYILCWTLVAASLSACAGPPAQTGNSAEQQRGNAREAQDELTTRVRK